MQTMPYPDPILSANIYASGCLDEVFRRTLGPFRVAVREHYPAREIYFWTMRYGCGGEHLKIRLHGPESECGALREKLGETVGRALADLGPAPAPIARPATPPIDVEDEEGPHADRSWCWTTYRRSDISFGVKPFLLDDEYVARFTRCLAAACEVALAGLVPNAEGVVPHLIRHNALTKLLIDGLAALGFDESQRREYLYFHRDWLVRYPLLKGGNSPAKARQVTDQFEQIQSEMTAELEALGSLAHFQWERANSDSDPWRHALAELWSYTAPLCEELSFRLDPFAALPTFTPVFKVFHHTANQLGLSMFEEALVYHILLCAVVPAESVHCDVLFEPEAMELPV